LFQETAERDLELNLKFDHSIVYSYDFTKDTNEYTKNLVKWAQNQEETSKVQTWDSRYNLPTTDEIAKFASDVYNEKKTTNVSENVTESPWRLLYCARGKVLNGLLEGFYGELYFNTENKYLQLVIKGTSSLGNVWSDIKNVGLRLKGGEVDSAFTFGEKVRELINEFKCKPMLLITGHSLGGYLAQIITYTITYCYADEDKKVKSRDVPNDDFGIYTAVFDAPAAFTQICSIDPHDPLDLKRLELPIVNFVKDVNLINSNSMVGPHLGLVVGIEDFKQNNSWLTKFMTTGSTTGWTISAT